MNRSSRHHCCLPPAVLLLLLLLVPLPAQALQTLDVEGVHLAYPSQEAHLAVRLAAKIPAMIAFLADRGLPVVTPLHVIIDPERDRPRPEVHIIPHRQIRIPLRAPGVFEDGCLEADPWAYFLFMGLCRHGMFQQVSGLPGSLRYLFGQMMSPNALSPAWIHDGVAHYLYQAYHPGARRNPLDELIRTHVPPPDLAHLSNHSETWPGPDIYRIYGRDFIAWVVDGYGWDAMLAFFRFHGRGLLPVEVATKAQRAFGATWADLWAVYRSRWPGEGDDTDAGADIGADAGAMPLVGMTTDGRSHWNAARVSPGPQRFRRRGRYGHQTPDGTIWLSELDDEGGLELVAYRAKGYGIGRPHTWDPGHGGVAVGRGGSRPMLLLFDPETGIDTEPRQISAPPGVIQLSGPVRADDGSVAVAGNTAGQWDIWIYDGTWHRETREPGLDVDPWIESGPGGTRLVFASNRNGRFQLYESVDGGRPRQVSACTSAALLPRGKRYLCLGAEGWRRLDLPTVVADSLKPRPREASSAEHQPAALPDPREPERLFSAEAARPYSALKSVWPNYVRPDMFYRGSDFQLGMATRGEDLSREVGIDGGFRYSFDLDHLSWRIGGRSHGLGARVTRYPIEYDPLFRPEVAEDRLEAQLSWEVVEDPELTLSTNYRQVDALHGGGSMDDHFWGGAHLGWDWGMGTIWTDLELFSEGSQSLFGGGRLQMGREIVTVLQAMGGKTWGTEVAGTTSYRIGGNVAEGFFTQRPSRLFPIRGFLQNLLESDQAAVSHLEVFWPLANLQKGYGTLPLFLHRLRLGTFVDAGVAADTVAADELLVGAGVELVTSMEIIWGFRSMFRLGIAWPVHQPDALDEEGPVVLIQLGRPL